jgi:hypothetical protein
MSIVDEVINEMRFPPRVNVYSEDMGSDGYKVVVWMFTEDSTGKVIDDPRFHVSSTTKFDLTAGYRDGITKQRIAQTIFDTVMLLFTHEVCEWTMYRNKYIKDPHPELHDEVKRGMLSRIRKMIRPL